MPKSYDIVDTKKTENGTLEKFITKSGIVKTKKDVIKDINSGYTVNTLNEHGHKAKVINVNNKYVRTVPTKKDCDNLGEL